MDAASLRTFLTNHNMLSQEELQLLHEAANDAAAIDLAVERGLLQASLVEDASALMADEMPKGLEPYLPGLVLLQEIGRGSSGRVFRAWQIKLRRIVAVKVLPRESLSNERAKTRFIREARIAARLSHPSLVRAWDIGSAGESVYIILEYVEGESLQSRLQRNGPLEIVETLRIAIGIAEGLAYAAANGIAHRDIKPANIQLTRAGVKILDLGLARPEGETELTLPMVALGTPAYISPEQARGESHLTPKSDVYALGVLIFRALSGKHPFKAIDGTEMLRAHIERMPPALNSSVKDIPKSLSELVETMMAKEVEDRPDAATVAGHLRLILTQIAGADDPKSSQRKKRSSVLAPIDSSDSVAVASKPKPAMLLVVGLLLGLVLGAWGLFILIGGESGEDEQAERDRKAAAAKAEAEKQARLAQEAKWQKADEELRSYQLDPAEAAKDKPPAEALKEALEDNNRRFSAE